MPPSTSTTPKPASLALLGASLAVYLALNLLVVFVLFPRGWLSGPGQLTGGLINATLVANGVMLAALLAFLRAGEGLRLSDVGLRAKGITAGIAVTVLLWLAINVVQAAFALRAGDGVNVAPAWVNRPVTSVVGGFLGQLLGNALFEEVLFRGLLFYHLVQHWAKSHRPMAGGVAAWVVSQLAFSLIHVPLRFATGYPLAALPGELLLLFGLGLLLAAAYWRTRNLYAVIGVHALSNAPLLVVESRVDLSTNGEIAAVGALLLIVAWPSRWRRERA